MLIGLATINPLEFSLLQAQRMEPTNLAATQEILRLILQIRIQHQHQLTISPLEISGTKQLIIKQEVSMLDIGYMVTGQTH